MVNVTFVVDVLHALKEQENKKWIGPNGKRARTLEQLILNPQDNDKSVALPAGLRWPNNLTL